MKLLGQGIMSMGSENPAASRILQKLGGEASADYKPLVIVETLKLELGIEIS